MKIIFLIGKKNCGKTTTMLQLYDLLTNSMKNKPVKNKLTRKDFHCEFIYKKRRVAIFSAGDTLGLILSAIFKYSEADYLILPFSEGGRHKAKILADFKKNKQHTSINKVVCKMGTNKAAITIANANDCKKINNAIK